MKKITFLYLFIFSIFFTIHAQVNIGIGGLAEQSTTYGNKHAWRAIDGDTNGEWSNGSIAHTKNELMPWWQVDLGFEVAINKLTLWPRTDCCQERVENYTIFISSTPFLGVSYDELMQNDEIWKVHEDGKLKSETDFDINQTGRYIRLWVINESKLAMNFAEMQVWVDDIGKQTQLLTFDDIEKKLTTNPSFDLNAISNVGLPITFEVIEGPATIEGNVCSLTGVAGWVTIRAKQEGNSEYYPSSPRFQTFEVIDASEVKPEVSLAAPNSVYPLSNPDLLAYKLIAATTIDHTDLFEVSNVNFIINEDIEIEATRENNIFVAYWKPEDFGDYNIKVKAFARHGTESTSDEVAISVIDNFQSQTVRTLDHEQIIWTKTDFNKYDTISLPSQIGAVKKITGKLAITCPPDGCDSWDRIAHVYARHPAGDWVEIIRYITPYGVACNHEIDLTDYASLLQGDVEFRFAVVTYEKGWEATLDLEYEAGKPEYPYTAINPMWNGRYNFGDPANKLTCDTFNIDFAPAVKKAKLRLVTTGHGWGENNTSNAAEFFHSTHRIFAGNKMFNQDLWMQCNPNPDNCSPQYGTWKYSRAGWCPGAIGQLFEYDLSEVLGQGNVEFKYFFGAYEDYCHPNNPFCISGVSCPDCDAGFNPHYVVASNIISFSDEPILSNTFTGTKKLDYLDIPISVFPNPSSGKFELISNELFSNPLIVITDIVGRSIYKKKIKGKKSINENIDLGNKNTGIFLITIRGDKKSGFKKLIVK